MIFNSNCLNYTSIYHSVIYNLQLCKTTLFLKPPENLFRKSAVMTQHLHPGDQLCSTHSKWKQLQNSKIIHSFGPKNADFYGFISWCITWVLGVVVPFIAVNDHNCNLGVITSPVKNMCCESVLKDATQLWWCHRSKSHLYKLKHVTQGKHIQKITFFFLPWNLSLREFVFLQPILRLIHSYIVNIIRDHHSFWDLWLVTKITPQWQYLNITVDSLG